MGAAGDQPTKRAAAAREWLRQMGIADSQVVVEHGNAASDLLISLARLYKVGPPVGELRVRVFALARAETKSLWGG